MASDEPFAFISDPGAHNGSLSSRLLRIARSNRIHYGSKRISCNLMDILTFLEGCAAMPHAESTPSTGHRAEENSRSAEKNMLPVSLPLLEVIFEDALTNKMLAQASRTIKLLHSGWVIDITTVGGGNLSGDVITLSDNGNMATKQIALAKKWTALVLAANLSGATSAAQNRIQGSIRRATSGAGMRISKAMTEAVRLAEDEDTIM